MDIRQIMLQMISSQVNPMSSPAVQEILNMRQQGLTPQQAMQRMAQKDPRFQQLQNQTPQQLDNTAKATIQQAGLNPNAVMQRLFKSF